MEQKLIFFDVDGTILTFQGTVPPSAVEAIHSAQANGHLCVVNTGRPYSHIEPVVTQIGFDGYICSCGQHILMNGESLFHTGLTPEVCREIVRLSRVCGLDLQYEDEAGIWYDRTQPKRREIQAYMEPFARRGFDIEGDIDVPGFRFDKFCVWLRPDSRPEPFLRYIQDYCSVIDRGGPLLEVVKKGCSKETGLKMVIAQTGIPLSRCYAIGDSTNDLPMLQCVPHSVAMGNAPAPVQDAVEYVTAPIEQDGLAKALVHYGLASL